MYSEHWNVLLQSLGVRTDGRLPEQVRPLSVNVGEEAMCCP